MVCFQNALKKELKETLLIRYFNNYVITGSLTQLQGQVQLAY